MQSTEPQKRPLSTSYVAVHQRIRAKRGPARNYPCAAHGCDEQARNWAWQRTGPYVEAEPTPMSGARAWGTRVEDYKPMCVPHAAQLDHGGTLTHCPNGHDRSPENSYSYPNGTTECLTCKRDYNSARKSLKLVKPCPRCGKEIQEQNIGRHIREVHEGQRRATLDDLNEVR